MNTMKDPMTLVAMSPILTYKVNSSAPTLKLPALAYDSHVHVFGPAARFPFAENRNFTPVDAPKETLFALHQKLGIGRCVIVQSVPMALTTASWKTLLPPVRGAISAWRWRRPTWLTQNSSVSRRPDFAACVSTS